MKIEENTVKVLRTARYFTNIPVSKVKSVLIVIHGYAQLAMDFLNNFEFLFDEDTLVIAPEGLSKFYSRNKIGASWMTKEDRENEIADYLNFLDNVFREINGKFDLSHSEINLLGFSQGVHTAVRFFIHSNESFNNLILCSSDFPKDADFEKLNVKLQKSRMYFIYGNKDEVIVEKTFEESKSLLKKNGIVFEEIVFEGKHEINKKSLKIILNK